MTRRTHAKILAFSLCISFGWYLGGSPGHTGVVFLTAIATVYSWELFWRRALDTTTWR